MQDCDISSATGSGVGSEGGSLSLLRCSIHDCKRHGVAMFGDLEGSEGDLLLCMLQTQTIATVPKTLQLFTCIKPPSHPLPLLRGCQMI